MQYPAHQTFIAPARRQPQVGLLILGLALTLAVYIVGIAGIFGALAAVSGFDGAVAWMQELASATGPTGTLLLLATFIGMALGPMVAARVIHGRSVGSLFGPLGRLARDFVLALLICAAVFGLLAFLPLPGATPLSNLEPGIWASFLPLAIVGVLLQTGAEEVLFRGYLQQQLAARFASPLVWMFLPSALFAVLHYQPEIMGENTWLMIGAVFVFAVLAADLTAVTGSIGAAWGLHFANNGMAILLVATEGPLSGLALYVAPMEASSPDIRPLILLDIATTVAIWLVVRIVVTRGRGGTRQRA